MDARMKRSLPAISILLAVSLPPLGCGKGADGPKAAPLTPTEAYARHADLEGRKVTVRGVYVQGFWDGGRPGDPWALVIQDAPGKRESVNCIVPKDQDREALDKASYPTVVVEGVVKTEAGDPPRVRLMDCTYKLQ